MTKKEAIQAMLDGKVLQNKSYTYSLLMFDEAKGFIDEIGHVIDITNEDFDNFKLYTSPKPKTKLWYWEFKDDGHWKISTRRLTKLSAMHDFAGWEYRKIEALGYIEVEE